jgi:hypothetical protein
VDLPSLFTVYQPFNHPEFLQHLKDLRFQDPKWLYDSRRQTAEPLQGDIFPRVELHFTDRGGAAAAYHGAAMLVANSCDTVPEQDPAAAMAPVQNLDRVSAELDDQPDRESRIQIIRANRRTSRFYLPATAEYPERYADFTFLSAVSTRRIQELYASGKQGILRLTEPGWYLLTGKLAHHFARGERE